MQINGRIEGKNGDRVDLLSGAGYVIAESRDFPGADFSRPNFAAVRLPRLLGRRPFLVRSLPASSIACPVTKMSRCYRGFASFSLGLWLWV